MYGTWTLSSRVGPCIKPPKKRKNLIKRNEIRQGETQVERAGQLLQWSIFTNALVQEIPRKEVTILFRTNKLKIHDLRVLS